MSKIGLGLVEIRDQEDFNSTNKTKIKTLCSIPNLKIRLSSQEQDQGCKTLVVLQVAAKVKE